MRYIKLYENFDDIDILCQKYYIRNYVINQDGIISTRAQVDLSHRNFSKLPLNFNRVGGFFDCGHNHLKSLKGCPNFVNGSFICSFNQLTTLEGGPTKVGWDYYCQNNNLTDMYGFPEKVAMSVNTVNNPIDEILALVKNSSPSTKKFIKWLNEYNVIKGNTIFEPGLDQAYYMATKQELEFDRKVFKNYSLI